MGMTELTTGMTGAQFRTAFNNNFKRTNINVFNVEDYGAVHDGETDDTAAIQLAINTCFTAGGGDVYFPNGVYLIAGELQNGVDTIDYNSQLYIPYSLHSSLDCNLRLIGESYNFQNSAGNIGVILKSTIAGTGTEPSVICSKGKYASLLNYTFVTIENIYVEIEAFIETTGISMSGLNLNYSSNCFLDHVCIRSNASRSEIIEPDNVVFGISLGRLQDDFPRVGHITVAYGFTYGVILGEGVHASTINVYGCKYGIMSLSNNYGSLIDYAVVHWCTYLITAHIGTIFGKEATVDTRLKVSYLLSERGFDGDGNTPEWLWNVDAIYDPDDILEGCMDYHKVGGTAITKTNGGVNFHTRNLGNGGGAYHWTTDARPTIVPAIGYNTTTSKMEALDSTGWHDLY